MQQFSSLLLGWLFAQYSFYHDTRQFNLGLLMGFNYNQVKIQYKNLLYSTPTAGRPTMVRVVGVPGLNLGIIANKKLHKYFDLRTIPQVSLQQRNIFIELPDSSVKRRLESAYLYFPILLKYKSQFYKGIRVYMMAGMQFGLNLTSDRRMRDNPELIRMQRWDWQWVAGVGVDIYLERVKLTPEISYSLGWRNVYDPTGMRYGYVIESIRNQTIYGNIQIE
ncbi:MAG: PorT family protein [Bacteroidia bacterium]|nr:PorT family protein [Bacteroidia bacterium]MDW8234998.1 porin family protein [Bacteroidia bacterium]